MGPLVNPRCCGCPILRMVPAQVPPHDPYAAVFGPPLLVDGGIDL
jgi:hypothetical protein